MGSTPPLKAAPILNDDVRFADLQPTLKQAADALVRLIEEATQQHSAQLSLQVSSFY